MSRQTFEFNPPVTVEDLRSALAIVPDEAVVTVGYGDRPVLRWDDAEEEGGPRLHIEMPPRVLA